MPKTNAHLHAQQQASTDTATLAEPMGQHLHPLPDHIEQLEQQIGATDGR